MRDPSRLRVAPGTFFDNRNSLILKYFTRKSFKVKDLAGIFP